MASENATALAVRKEESVEVVDAKPCPDETFGVNPQVSPCAKAAKPSPSECTHNQLLEIVIGLGRRFRTAKEDVTTHKEYILRLKNEVFKVSFGSVGVFVPVKYKTKEGKSAAKKMRWKEFSKTQFGVSAGWVNRICGGKAEGRCPSRTAKPESETAPYKHGYQAAKAEMQMQLYAAAEKQAALASRIAVLEKENEKLQRIAHQFQVQSQVGEGKPASNLGERVEDINDIETLAAEAFRIINGKFGQRLMGSPDGNRLVEIAKKAAQISSLPPATEIPTLVVQETVEAAAGNGSFPQEDPEEIAAAAQKSTTARDKDKPARNARATAGTEEPPKPTPDDNSGITPERIEALKKKLAEQTAKEERMKTKALADLEAAKGDRKKTADLIMQHLSGDLIHSWRMDNLRERDEFLRGLTDNFLRETLNLLTRAGKLKKPMGGRSRWIHAEGRLGGFN